MRILPRPLASLRKLNLSQNALEELPLGLFDSVSGLEVLDLSYNQLSILGPYPSTFYIV